MVKLIRSLNEIKDENKKTSLLQNMGHPNIELDRLSYDSVETEQVIRKQFRSKNARQMIHKIPSQLRRRLSDKLAIGDRRLASSALFNKTTIDFLQGTPFDRIVR